MILMAGSGIGAAIDESVLALGNNSTSDDILSVVADFNVNTNKGPAPLSVQFTDLSQNATAINWDFENDGKVDSMNKNEVHVYTVPGTYIVKLTASDEKGSASKSVTIIVTQAIADNSSTGDNGNNENGEDDSGSSSSGGNHQSSSSGGSSGGAGGSPEPQSNVEVKEISQVFITNGKEIKFDFAKNVTCVVYVSFDAKKNAGKTTTIVEMLKGKSALVSKLPEGEVYKSFNIWVGNSGFATSKNIENPVACFKVEKAWVQEKNIDQASITLNRYNEDKWEKLPVSQSGEDGTYLYFIASVPGFSSFAITGISKGTPEKTVSSVGSVVLTSDANDTVIKGGKDSSTPGFEIVYGVIGMLCGFLYRRR